ncbi:AsnC family transcriptional regulator [Hymenobacter aerilatus]|uniref:AsnC family transcriptional regulator n=4 Tax=Hymenobacter TaxID=89966 RepID=A0A8T9SUX5_9BACT|nr:MULTISPECIES: AsnC family transcriptional regulator [Hymenobacter]MBC6610592.1 AsnC family transcriptional regulator [Hymenobacter citatus]MBO3272621.1 AsnC family transcriptional regulator [Hymenobacter defluvii]MBW3128812.1 AsnC family transcriptional regulator [Hymenobacter profundi]QNE40499.1 AsnC family transcriptional regulator [Hymenobacter sp. NBH84]UOR05567.1 AsnC family transcriptional regulator [Hymenobacter aerilatus]
MARNYELDDTDRKILALLIADAKMPYTEIARKVHVSGGTVHVRMARLEELGIVQGATLRIDYEKLGYGVTAFIGIYLLKSSMYNGVAEEMKKIPEIVSMNYTTGNYGIFARLVCRDTQHLREVLHDQIQLIEGIERTETLISLEESLNRPIQLL